MVDPVRRSVRDYENLARNARSLGSIKSEKLVLEFDRGSAIDRGMMRPDQASAVKIKIETD